MSWKSLGKRFPNTRKKKSVSDEQLISNIAHLWCYYVQYVHEEKTIDGKIEYFRNGERDRIPDVYDTHSDLSLHDLDALIYEGISQGSVMDFGENNVFQHYLKTQFQSEVLS